MLLEFHGTSADNRPGNGSFQILFIMDHLVTLWVKMLESLDDILHALLPFLNDSCEVLHARLLLEGRIIEISCLVSSLIYCCLLWRVGLVISLG